MNQIELEVIKQNIENLSNKHKVFLIEHILKKYPGIVEFAKETEIGRKVWMHNYGDLAKEYFDGD